MPSNGVPILVFGILLVGFALAERRLERAWLTAPLVFTAAGWAVGALDGRRYLGLEVGDVHQLAEIALVLLLFHDASKLRVSDLRAEWGLAARLLLVALPLTMLAGYGTAALLLPGLGVGLTLLIAAALAPTDAALGAPTVSNPAVPGRIRRLLNAESGLNDGLATPVVLIALALAAGESFGPGGAFVALAVGGVGGAVIGWVGGRGVALARGRRWMTVGGRGVVMLSLPALAYYGSTAVGGNGFVAAFVAGVAFAIGAGRLAHEQSAETALESGIEILGAAVWFIFGATIGPIVAEGLGWRPFVFALLSLTILRLLPVAVSLLGSGLRRETVWFVGWFGPRGLASLIFVLLSIEQLGTEEGILDEPHAVVAATVGLTVLLSVVAHGLSGEPLAERYGAWTRRVRPAVETEAG